jgi:hypothetical protein
MPLTHCLAFNYRFATSQNAAASGLFHTAFHNTGQGKEKSPLLLRQKDPTPAGEDKPV